MQVEVHEEVVVEDEEEMEVVQELVVIEIVLGNPNKGGNKYAERNT